MGGTVYAKRINVGGLLISTGHDNPNGEIQGKRGEVIVSSDPLEPGIFQNMDDGTRWSLLAPREKLTLGLARNILTGRGEDTALVQLGLLSEVFYSFEDLPPSPPTSPAYAVIWPIGQDVWDIAWYINGTWQLTSFPWNKPGLPLAGDWIVNTIPEIGTNNANWKFSMGSELQVLAPGNGKRILQLAVKLGANAVGTTHSWALWKSTAVSAAQPALGTYSLLLDSGVFTYVQADTWQPVPLNIEPPSVATNEWWHPQIWVGQGGQLQNISTARSSGWLNETFARVNAGLYRSAPGDNPGIVQTPNIRQPTLLYGLTSLGIGD